MRLVAESGLWSTGEVPEPAPLTAVLEVAGAVLSWTVDDGSGSAHIAFTAAERADWLWRLAGENGHDAIVTALTARAPEGELEVPGVTLDTAALNRLRHLAIGHWLRRWWPASRRDGIADLDAALLDAELALLTAGAQEYFTDDTLDSDISGLLRPHADLLAGLSRLGDPRIAELARACTALAEDTGVPPPDRPPVVARRDDYALAAGSDGQGGPATAIAAGTGSVRWAAVPPGIFDSAEDTVDWHIDAVGAEVIARVHADLSGGASPAGVGVRLASGAIGGAGVLDETGRATVALFEAHEPVTETIAWNHDWRDTDVMIGVPVRESREHRERAREFARSRLRTPGADAFLAEVLAAESDY
ncbi:hypothetical protein JDV09_19780 [Mycobacterium sp. Y57]|uniref:hypothetical protein n=1 Tax=Mycolicibacterium xanthum TaxID=2796469 RepID=UPI001C85E1F9|nr:hypothetical protein [Mycolicibacterium xanthum]MBX7434319.1 hypothetical protein [Mycolicibacterium xanthum]